MSDIVLINISGADQPGLTASLMQILAEYDVTVLDIGQAMIHDTLSLGILVEIPNTQDSSPVLKDVLFHIHAKDMQIKFTPVHTEDYEKWVQSKGKAKHVITILGRTLSAAHLKRVASVITANDLNIQDIVRLSGRRSLHEGGEQARACIEFTVSGTPADWDAMKSEFMNISQEMGVDVAFQEDNRYRRNRRLVVFDMDSTLIQQEVIDELAKAANVGDQVAEITESAMAGELDFKQSFEKRLALLEGLSTDVLDGIAQRLVLNEGAERLIKNLKDLGYKTAIVSGGFTYFGNHLKNKLGVDYVFANELDVVDGKVTGRVKGTVVDGQRKAELVKELAQKENIDLEQVIAVGDGANDLPMLQTAGLGIAFRAKPLVKANARQAISNLGLDGILYLIGVRDQDAAM